MNKSKFLKRSLAALLAILMVATMIPSAFAAEGDPVHQDLKITVDTYSATQTENGDYTVTVWDSNDVTINWADIPGTTVTLVTGGKNPGVRLGLPQTLFLAENANIEGEDVYSVTLMEKVGSAAEVPHKLTITVESTIPDWNADLGAVRVDNTSGEYDIGYLTGAKLAGYDIKTKNNKMEAHAIKGEVNNDAETVTITLPFGMTPVQAGFGAGAITTPKAVFAAKSVHAKVALVDDGTKVTGVTVTAMDGTVKNFSVVYKQEQIFESFTNSTNLSDLEAVPASGLSQLDVELKATNKDLSNYRQYSWADSAYWVPEFTSTANVQRIMGTSGEARGTAVTNGAVLNYDKTAANAARGEFFEDAASATDKDNTNTNAFLKLITSGHASWTVGAGANKATNVVYLLVRTKANPLGAFLQVNLKAVTPAPAKAYITEVQTEDTQSVCDIDKDTRNITLTVDNRYSFKIGATPDNTELTDPAAKMTLHINTSANSTIDLPQLPGTNVDNGDGKWWRDGSSTDTHHIIKGVMGKSGSVLVRVWSADKTYIDYTINFVAATSESLGLKQIELRKADGTHIQSAIVDSDDKHTFYLKVPYEYHAGKAVTADVASPLTDCQLLVFPDPGAVVVPGKDATLGNAFENAITTMGNVWLEGYTSNAGTGVTASDLAGFEDTLYLTVTNGDNQNKEIYQLILQREKPLEVAEITAVTANKALDDDYIFSVASTLGTQVGNTKDVGQAYAGAIDKDGNELPATVDETAKTIKVQVPYDWDNDTDTLYLTGLTRAGYSFHRVSNTVAAGGAITYAAKLNGDVSSFVLDTIKQEDQTNKSDASGDPWMMGFTNLTTNPNATRAENIIYVFSEKDRFPDVDAAAITPSAGDIAEKATKAYKVYIEKVGAANIGNALNNVSATGATASFNSNLGLISVSVPGSYNWTSYRADSSKDFKLTFSTSEGALVIDKKKYDDNVDVSGYKTGFNAGALTATDGKYVNGMTGRAAGTDDKADAKVYLNQLNEFYDINNATFFVKNGELYTYDELSGKETQVTGLGERFTNSNWGKIKTKQAEIRVYREDQSSFRNYRLDLKVGEPSSAKDITSLKVGDVTATRSGSSFTAVLPEDAEKEQALTIEASALAAVMVNDEPYQADRKIDVSKEVTIVVTAEDGSKTTYSLTTSFGTVTPPDPDKKPSDNYTDIPSGTIGEYVKKGIDLGIMIGSGNKFLPDNKITRRDFALMVARADVMAKDPSIKTAEAAQAELLKQYSGTPKFDDTKKLTDIYNAAIEYCNKKDIISGKPGNKFDPAGNVTRLETARMISGWAEVTDESKTTNINNIKDWNKINWGKQYVNSVYAAGLMSGYGDASNSSFRPAQNLTRAEAARVIVSTFEKKTGAN